MDKRFNSVNTLIRYKITDSLELLFKIQGAVFHEKFHETFYDIIFFLF